MGKSLGEKIGSGAWIGRICTNPVILHRNVFGRFLIHDIVLNISISRSFFFSSLTGVRPPKSGTSLRMQVIQDQINSVQLELNWEV